MNYAATAKATEAPNFNKSPINTSDFPQFLQAMQERYLGFAGRQLFLVNLKSLQLSEIFLDNLPAEHRQHFNCLRCLNFIDRVGHLVVINDSGAVESAVWPDDNKVASIFAEAVAALHSVVQSAEVNDVFYSEEPVFGVEANTVHTDTGSVTWTHMHLHNAAVFSAVDKDAFQAMAEKREDVKNVRLALEMFTPAMTQMALSVVQSNALFRSEKVEGPAVWINDVATKNRDTRNNKHLNNLLWLAIGTAPPGYAHPRSTMIGTLLDDVKAQLGFDDIVKRFTAKMQPDVYRRPTALPTEGNVKQAEKLIENMGATESLKRRYARLYDLETLWQSPPKKAAQNTGGVFGGVATKQSQSRDDDRSLNTAGASAVRMSWAKFQRDVLPNAAHLEAFTGHGNQPFFGLTAALNVDAPPILQWDRKDRRNHVSAFTNIHGVPASTWGLPSGTYVEVTAVCNMPWMWHDVPSNMPKGVMFIIKGARQSQDHRGLMLFPEVLRSEFHGVSKVIEQFSREGTLVGAAEADANGLALVDGSNSELRIRVTSKAGLTVVYDLDRYE